MKLVDNVWGKVFLGWVIIIATYFVTLLLSANIGGLLFPTFDHLGGNSYQVNKQNASFFQLFVALMMVIFPYVVGGFYTKKFLPEVKQGAVWVSLIPVLAERMIIFLLGLYFVPQRFSNWNLNTVVPFIQWKTPAFYFNYMYIIAGLVSVMICIVVANRQTAKS